MKNLLPPLRARYFKNPKDLYKFYKAGFKEEKEKFTQDEDFWKGYEDVIDIPDQTSGSLTILPTPIGNMLDLSLRQYSILKQSDIIASEDTRTTGLLMKLMQELSFQKSQRIQELKQENAYKRAELDEQAFDISGDAFVEHTYKRIRKLREQKGRGIMIAYNSHNQAARTPKLIKAIKMGMNIALVSDAGTPLISDPGNMLVKQCVTEGLQVKGVGGPVAAINALLISGFPNQQFYFQGYLGKGAGKKQGRVEELRDMRKTVILYEGNTRVISTLQCFSEVYGGEHLVFVACELTKINERHFRGEVDRVIEQIEREIEIRGKLAGEITIVIAPYDGEEKQEGITLEVQRIIQVLEAQFALTSRSFREAFSGITGFSSKQVAKILEEYKERGNRVQIISGIQQMADTNIVRIPPFQYIHVLDYNTNITRVIEGPLTFIRKEHEKLVSGPDQMIKIPPRSYCIIQNPVLKDPSTGELLQDSYGMIKVKFGDAEVRTNESHPNPFPLYPWERVDTKITKIPIIQQNCAYKLRANRDHVDEQGNFRQAGEEWLHKGPCSYIPHVACEVLQEVKPFVIKPNCAIKIKATRKTTDIYGNERQAGEEWLIKESGAYLPLVDEEITSEVKALVLTERKAYHLRALNDFKDAYGVERKAGEEWLVTLKNADTHIPDVYEDVVKEVKAYVLNNRQFCYILDPVDPNTGYNRFGKKILKKGECTFFLQPYESLEFGIQDVYVLGEEEALLLRAKENFEESKTVTRVAGERWMIYGPCDYIPPIEVEVITRRKAIPLDENEGIYVRNLKTGEVSAITGQCYMLKPYEELWELELPDVVEELIARQNQGIATQIPKPGKGRESSAYEKIEVQYRRDKTKVVTFNVPHNSAVQVYDFKKNRSRVVFGPDRIMLGPDEQFTVLNLSGSTPKKENQIQNLALLLGPDFMTDVVIVETSDHATLQLKLSYNWFFDIDKSDEDQCNKIFQVRDFVGDACKTIASRIRGAVSTQTFENFHQNSAEIIRAGVFGRQGDSIRTSLRFPANDLVITNVDLHNLAPTDKRTQESLQKSVNLAIEIMTKSQEDRAEHESKRQEQHQAGLLHLQKVKDAIDSQASQIKLAELQAKSTEIELTSKAVAQAKSQAASQYIQYETMVKETEFEVQAKSIKQTNELKTIREQHEAEIEHLKALKDLEIQKARELADIETGKFKQIVSAIGTETIVSMARAGPAAQTRILKALGLKGFMVMNSKNPINLLGTAHGLLNQGQ